MIDATLDVYRGLAYATVLTLASNLPPTVHIFCARPAQIGRVRSSFSSLHPNRGRAGATNSTQKSSSLTLPPSTIEPGTRARTACPPRPTLCACVNKKKSRARIFADEIFTRLNFHHYCAALVRLIIGHHQFLYVPEFCVQFLVSSLLRLVRFVLLQLRVLFPYLPLQYLQGEKQDVVIRITHTTINTLPMPKQRFLHSPHHKFMHLYIHTTNQHILQPTPKRRKISQFPSFLPLLLQFPY